jgi:hypothetical protein
MRTLHQLAGIRPGAKNRRVMGQGFYTVVAFGSIQTFTEEFQDKFVNLLYDIGKKNNVQGRSKYEAKDDWFGFYVADGGSGVGDDGKCELMSYSVLDASLIPEEVDSRWPEQLKKCKTAYKQLQQAAKKQGVLLGPGKLLLVNDYD